MFNFFKEKLPTKEIVYKDKKLTEAELMLEFAEHFGDIGVYDIDPKEEKRMFEELLAIDYFQTYLRATIARDMQMYFAATTDQQRDIIKGRAARAASLRGKLTTQTDTEVKGTKMKGLRYRA